MKSMSNEIYRMKEAPAAMADNVRDLNTRMGDVDKVAKTNEGILKILKNMEKQRQNDLAGINANFRTIDKKLATRPTVAVANRLQPAGQIAKATAKGAMYYGPRTALFLVITIVSIAIAAIFYGGQFEQPEVITAAWMAIYACAGAFVPSAALTWITRRK